MAEPPTPKEAERISNEFLEKETLMLQHELIKNVCCGKWKISITRKQYPIWKQKYEHFWLAKGWKVSYGILTGFTLKVCPES